MIIMDPLIILISYYVTTVSIYTIIQKTWSSIEEYLTGANVIKFSDTLIANIISLTISTIIFKYYNLF